LNYEGISVFTGKSVSVKVEADIISDVKEIKTSKKLPYISPGFLDMQVNGYKGSDYSLEDFNIKHMKNIIEGLAASGTTQHVPTIVSSPQGLIVRNLKIISSAVDKYPEIADAVSGIHIEGPYISSEEGPRGAHDPEYIRDPDIDEFEEWQKAGGNRISIVTLAPERKGAIKFIKSIVAKRVTAAIGHSGASPKEINSAVDAGARLSTHLGNGSYAVIPRLENYIWEQLARDELTIGVISDGFHLPSSVVKVFTRVKGGERIILVSDAALLGGMDPGIYKWGNLDIEVYNDGHLGLAGTEYLAGAGHLLNWDIAHYMKFTGCSLAETINLCSVNPARVLRLKNNYGKLKVGSPANLVIFNYAKGDDALDIIKTVRMGREVFTQ